MIIESGKPIPGVYSVEEVFEYIVCDKCDSFSIEHQQQRSAMAIAKRNFFRCRKCGNEEITNELIQNYSNREPDVEVSLTIKKFLYTLVG